MPQEVKILIPETGKNESVDVRVMSVGNRLVDCSLKVFLFPKAKTEQSRAEFLKEQIEQYAPDYKVVEIGLDGKQNLPFLFRHQ